MGKFAEQVKDYFDKGVAASKVAINKAGTVVQGLGELGVLKIELQKLESQKKKELLNLGKAVYALFTKDKKEQVAVTEDTLSPIIAELKAIEKNIAKHEKAIKEAESAEKNNGGKK